MHNVLNCFFSCRSYYNVKTLGSSKKFTTPYGARLEWDLESPPEEQNIKIEKILAVPCRLILHLKDKFLIRNKKRWSQVRVSNIKHILQSCGRYEYLLSEHHISLGQRQREI